MTAPSARPQWTAEPTGPADCAQPVVLLLQHAMDGERLGAEVGARVRVVQTLSDGSIPPHDMEKVVAIVLRSGVHLRESDVQAFPRLRAVIRAGSGIDNIDTEALRRRGIRLHRNAGASAGAVAEWVMIALLALARRIPLGHNALLAGLHLKDNCLAAPLAGLRVAIWGAGPVGCAAGEVLRPLVAGVVYARWPSVAAGLPQMSASELPRWADAHVIALPLRPSTRRFVDDRWLAAAASRRPMLVCVGRLGTIDLPAVAAALRAGDVSGLAVDPIERGDVAKLSDIVHGPVNLLASPHVGAQRTDVRETLDTWTIRVLRTELAGARSRDVAGPQVQHNGRGGR